VTSDLAAGPAGDQPSKAGPRGRAVRALWCRVPDREVYTTGPGAAAASDEPGNGPTATSDERGRRSPA